MRTVPPHDEQLQPRTGLRSEREQLRGQYAPDERDEEDVIIVVSTIFVRGFREAVDGNELRSGPQCCLRSLGANSEPTECERCSYHAKERDKREPDSARRRRLG